MMMAADFNALANNIEMLRNNLDHSCNGCGAPRDLGEKYCEYCGRR